MARMPGLPSAKSAGACAACSAATNRSSAASRVVGSFIRPLRRISQRKGNLTARWAKSGKVPSGWGHVSGPGLGMRLAHYFYNKLQYSGQFQPLSDRQRALQADGHRVVGEIEQRLQRESER